MKICVVAAGSIGGYVGVRLALAGEDVKLIARGKNLEAIEGHAPYDGRWHRPHHAAPGIRATASLAEAGAQDLVILGMKAHQVEPVARELHHLLHDDTVVVPVQNGIPWWYFQRHGWPFEGRAIETVDPEGCVMRAIDPRRIIGCVVYPACELLAPGVVRHIEGDRFRLGELDGTTRERVQRVAATFVRAGMKAPILVSIRAEIWLKLRGNLTFNPINALTHSTLVDICQFPPTRELAAAMIRDAETVANRLGEHVPGLAREGHRRRKGIAGAPRRSASTRPRCFRTSNRGATRRSTLSSAR